MSGASSYFSWTKTFRYAAWYGKLVFVIIFKKMCYLIRNMLICSTNIVLLFTSLCYSSSYPMSQESLTSILNGLLPVLQNKVNNSNICSVFRQGITNPWVPWPRTLIFWQKMPKPTMSQGHKFSKFVHFIPLLPIHPKHLTPCIQH